MLFKQKHFIHECVTRYILKYNRSLMTQKLQSVIKRQTKWAAYDHFYKNNGLHFLFMYWVSVYIATVLTTVSWSLLHCDGANCVYCWLHHTHCSNCVQCFSMIETKRAKNWCWMVLRPRPVLRRITCVTMTIDSFRKIQSYRMPTLHFNLEATCWASWSTI